MAKVEVLFDGYSKEIDETRMDANCSCTLVITSENKKIIIDTMTAWDKEKIIKALSERKIRPEEMDYAISTHGHSDHVGNNNLFLSAEHIVGTTVHRGTMFYERNIQNESYKPCEDVEIIATPGHTFEDISVLVNAASERNDKLCKIAITGDLFEKEEDIADASLWQNLGNPLLRKSQAEMRLKILQMCDYVVPGHGPMFEVTDSMRKIVKAQAASLS